MRYPYDMTNEMLTNYLNIMNRLTGMGDDAEIRRSIREKIEQAEDFHNIDKVSYIKLMAYTASWCLKRKVFQIVEECFVR